MNDQQEHHAQANPAFHQGELQVQERLGVREKLAPIGRKVFRDFMPDQHRELFCRLPYLVIGSLDTDGQPWASIVAGEPGFISSPDSRHLCVTALPVEADPLANNVAIGAPIALLGIELATRRRNRANGHVAGLTPGGIEVRVNQSFGNCPKYIQARVPVARRQHETTTPSTVTRRDDLDKAMQKVIQQADTCFIASSFSRGDNLSAVDAERPPQEGVDVSHRGGRPGFLHVESADVLLLPDYVGNYFFNTIGNLLVHPRAGLLIPDFESGDLLFIAVETDIIWGGAALDAHPGAQRLLRLHVRRVHRLTQVLPWEWSSPQLSPHLP